MLKMSSLKRYSQTHLIKEESVLEHTGFVVMMCNLISMKMAENGDFIDTGILLSKATVHDMDEIITGDIPRPTKYYNVGIREALQEIEDQNMMEISKHADLGDSLYSNWKYAKDGTEGYIVGLCDCLAVVYKAWQEVVMYGNKAMIEHAINLRSQLHKKGDGLVGLKLNSYNKHYLMDTINQALSICDEIKKSGE